MSPKGIADIAIGDDVIWDCHQSGKWSAEVAALLKRLDDLVAMGWRIIRLTEVSPKKFRKPLQRWCKANGWHIQHPRRKGANECAILSKRKITRRNAMKATELQLKVGRTAPTFLVGAHIKGAGWCRVIHTPAHNLKLRKGLWPTRVYFSIADFFHKYAYKRVIKKKKRETLSADFNLHLLNDEVRKWLDEWFPGFTLAVGKHQDPTEGTRVIDGFVTTDEVVMDGKTIKFKKSDLDHDPVGIKRKAA